ncbi:MAG: ABC transporter ATP-binding protein [Phycisphaeraceae bacterium]|nr:ABC transporter ATP-binding protein [Phycisphaeraceae bacterium]
MSAIASMPAPHTDPSGRDLAVRCRGVVKNYGSGASVVRALRGIDLDVYAGELLMLVGPSGCGKTTLISVIAGVLDRDEGECTVYGEDFSAMNSRQRTRFRGQTIGFVFQSFNLIPTLTIAENVSVPLILNGTDRRTALKKAKDILATVGLGERVNDAPNRLSGGQQQRVAIARALVHDPKLIVCDEPTSALDHETGHRILELLKGVAMGGNRSLVVVTHDNRIFDFADRIAHMDDGQVDKIVGSAKDLYGPSFDSAARGGERP